MAHSTVLAERSELDHFQRDAKYARPTRQIIENLTADTQPLLSALRRELVFFKSPLALEQVIAIYEEAIATAVQDPKKFARIPMASDVFCEHFRSREAYQSLGLIDEDGHKEHLDEDTKKALGRMGTILNGLRNTVITSVGQACASMWNLKERVAENFVKSGFHSWVVKLGEDKVILISKGMPQKAFEKYKIRKWCSGKMEAAGLKQPKIYNIGTRPAMHAFMELAPGDAIAELWAKDSNPSYHVKLNPALGSLGDFFRVCRQRIPLDGFGNLVPDGDGGYKGEFSSAQEALAQDLDSIFLLSDYPGSPYLKVAEDLGVLTKVELAALYRAREDLLGIEEQAFLTNGEPYPGNFIYDLDTERLSALDLDEARACTPIELAARLMDAWKIGGQYLTPRDLCLRHVFETFEVDTEARIELEKNASKLAALRKLREANDLIEGRNPKDIGPQDMGAIELYHFDIRSYLIQAGLIKALRST